MSQLQDATRPVLSLSIFSTNITDLREDSGTVRGEWCISICYLQNFRIISEKDLTLALHCCQNNPNDCLSVSGWREFLSQVITWNLLWLWKLKSVCWLAELILFEIFSRCFGFLNEAISGLACGDSLKYEWDPPVSPPEYDTPTVSTLCILWCPVSTLCILWCPVSTLCILCFPVSTLLYLVGCIYISMSVVTTPNVSVHIAWLVITCSNILPILFWLNWSWIRYDVTKIN